MTERRHSAQDFEVYSNDLRQMIEIVADETFDEVSPHGDWEQIDADPSADLYKIKLVNGKLGLFAKTYAPCTNDYALKHFQTLSELATHDLGFPIAIPLGVSNRTIFFESGIYIRTISYTQIPKEDRLLIARICDKYEIKGMETGNRIDVIEINGQEFGVDMLDDSNSEMFRYSGFQL